MRGSRGDEGITPCPETWVTVTLMQLGDHNFHSLRHSAVSNTYRATRDLFLAQRFPRHASPLTAVIHTHLADEELAEGVRDLPC